MSRTCFRCRAKTYADWVWHSSYIGELWRTKQFITKFSESFLWKLILLVTNTCISCPLAVMICCAAPVGCGWWPGWSWTWVITVWPVPACWAVWYIATNWYLKGETKEGITLHENQAQYSPIYDAYHSVSQVLAMPWERAHQAIPDNQYPTFIHVFQLKSTLEPGEALRFLSGHTHRL